MVPDEQVKVKVEDGRVTLTGMLDWNYQRTSAEEAIRNIQGVIGISNLIELRHRVTPSDVKKHIISALHRSAALEAQAIRVDVDGNKVTLGGRVKTWNDRKIAEQAAWATTGVTAVDDKLTVG